MTGSKCISANNQIRLLLVEPNPVESKLLQELLLDQTPSDSGRQTLEVCAVGSLEDAIAQLKQHSFDIALIDSVSRDIQQLVLFNAIKAKASDLPTIILIDEPDQQLLRKAMDEGVQDYLLKREVNSSNLLTTISHVVLRAQLKRKSDASPLTAAGESAISGQEIDELTGLPRQALFLECLEYELKRARRYSQYMALMFIHVQEMGGEQAQADNKSDEMIRQVYAERLKSILRASDTTGLYGDNQFACILNDLSEQEDVHVILRKVESALSVPVQAQSGELNATIKIGLALYPGDSDGADGLIQCASAALEGARQKRGVQSEVFNTHVRAQDIERFKVADAVRHALEKNELRLHVQPVLELEQKNVVVAEAQLYWEHLDYAEISSRDILFLAELAGLIQPVAEWLLRQACMQFRSLQQQQANLKMRVHMPSGILRNTGFPALVKVILEETDVLASDLQLAAPVSAIMQSPEKAHEVLGQLERTGISIFLDDFGGSRSSLPILRDYPVSGLIIDDLIVSRISAHQDACSIVKTIISMCQALHLQLTAKGVTTATQEKLLRDLHCPSVQGDYYAPAVSGDKFFKLPLWGDVAENEEIEEQDDRDIAQRIRDSLVSLNNLPPMSQTAQKLLDIRNHPEADIDQLDAIIEQDPAIAAQIIRYANAPFFGNQGQIKTIKQAVMTALGFEGALNMALGIAVLGNLQVSGKACIDLHAFWRHAVYAAALSQAIAREIKIAGIMPGIAWLAGLLQNIGYLALCYDFQPELEKVKMKKRQYPDLLATEVEERALGISHAEVGLHLLRSWQLPEEIITAVFEHHNVSYVGAHAVYANIVLIANRMLAQQGIGDEPLGMAPFGILQMLSLSEERLQKIMDGIIDSREGLDTMSNHLAA